MAGVLLALSAYRMTSPLPTLTPSPLDQEHPRPQLQRQDWVSLDGEWEFAAEQAATWAAPADVRWTERIVVPFAPETPASGIDRRGFVPVCWYRRLVRTPERPANTRVLLHFGAVDYLAHVWVNGALVGTHEGGYTPFSFDITPWLRDGETQEIVVRAEDDPYDLAKPRGKQDWQLDPHSIWYVRTSGIWQTVWLEIGRASCRERV